MEGKKLWQWLKPMLLILPVLAVTLLALWELVDRNANRLGATTLNQLSLTDEPPLAVEQTETNRGQTGSLLAPKEESFDQLTELLSDSSNRISSWADLVALISRTTPSATEFGNSFRSSDYVQRPESGANGPPAATAPADVNNEVPASTPPPENNNGTTSTTGNNNSGSGNSGTGNSGSGNSGSGNGDDDCDSSGSGNHCDDDD